MSRNKFSLLISFGFVALLFAAQISAQDITASEVPNSLKGFFAENKEAKYPEISAVEPVCDGNYLLAAHDDDASLRLINPANGVIENKLDFPTVVAGNPKWEAMSKDGAGNFYIIGNHENDPQSKLFKFRIDTGDCSKPSTIKIVKADELDLKASLTTKGFSTHKDATCGSAIRIEGIAYRDINGKEWLIIGLREPCHENNVIVYKADVSNGKTKLDIEPFFEFSAGRPDKSPIPFQLSSIEYVEELEGFLILTSTEDDLNAFYGNALWLVSDEQLKYTEAQLQKVLPKKLLQFQPKMKAEGVTVISKDTAKATLRLAVMFDNDCNYQPESKNCFSGGDRAAGKFGLIEVAYKTNCPKGNGFFVLYYGTDPKIYDRIIAEKPNFVILSENSNNKETATKFAGIQTLIYVSMTHKRKDAAKILGIPLGDLKDHSCALIKAANVFDSEAAVAVNNGFGGIFFDCARFALDDATVIRFNQPLIKMLQSSQQTIHDWNRERVEKLRATAPNLLVIMNPGVANVDLKMFEYSDLVSVENRWNRKVTTFPMESVPAWRWLAVSGDPGKEVAKDAKQAIQRLDTFRKNGGFWYYSPPYDSKEASHGKLMKDEEFKQYAAYARSTQMACNK